VPCRHGNPTDHVCFSIVMNIRRWTPGAVIGFARAVPLPLLTVLTQRRVIDHGTVHSAGCRAR